MTTSSLFYGPSGFVLRGDGTYGFNQLITCYPIQPDPKIPLPSQAYTYKWEYLADGTSNWQSLISSKSTYALNFADAGKYIRCTVSLSDNLGNIIIFTTPTIHILSGTSGADLIVGGDSVDIINSLNGNDSINASAGDDFVSGGSGNDIIIGGDGNDYLNGGDANDLLNGGSGIDTADYSTATAAITANLVLGTSIGDGIDSLISIENLNGSSGNDVLIGNENVNALSGGGGNDILIGGAGDDILNGGDDIDTVDYTYLSIGLSINLSSGIALGDGADVLLSIENILGGSAGDTLIGDSENNTISGFDGNDTVSGGAGNDTINGGSGTDTIDYSTALGVSVNLATGLVSGDGVDHLISIENIIGSRFSDSFLGDSANNFISGGDGNDTLNGGAGNDILGGGYGTDTADYSTSNSGVKVNLSLGASSGDGSDVLSSIENLIGSNHSDILIGDSGINNFRGGAGDDILDGRNGSDTVDYSTMATSITVNLKKGIATGDGIDTLVSIENITGGSGDDYLFGDASDNIINGGAGNDMLNGGAGFDTADYSNSLISILANLKEKTATGNGTDKLYLIENLTGGFNDDKLVGDSGNNVLSGGGGNDTLCGGDGNDILNGGEGLDTADYSTTSTAVLVSLFQKTVTGDGTDLLVSIENITGGSGNDILIGDAVNNLVDGGIGNDTLSGGDGDDTLNGGLGIDTADYATVAVIVTVNLSSGTATADGIDTLASIENIIGGSSNDILIGDSNDNNLRGCDGNDLLTGAAGNDVLNGGSGIDTADYSSASTDITVNLKKGIALGDGNDILVSIENITGGNGNDNFVGDTTNNIFQGGGGDDTLSGALGNDTLNGGSGSDTVDYSGVSSSLVVNLFTGVATGDGVDTLISIENIKGGSFSDILTGDLSNNSMSGGAGNDILSGAAGNDILNGGDGIDTVDYSSASTEVIANLITGLSYGDGNDSITNIENILGGVGADTLIGDTLSNILSGGDGSDTLSGGAGNDTLIGGTGLDTADFSTAAFGVTANLFTGTSLGDGNDILSSIENISGGSGNDTLIGDNSNNILNGGSGDDTLTGGNGDDYLNGGAGTDTVDYSPVSASIIINLAAGTTQGEGTDILFSIENIRGGTYNDIITGDSLVNFLSGSSGDDILDGGGGDDTLNGGSGTDTAIFSSANAAVIADLIAGSSTGLGFVTFISIENLTGGLRNDVLIGDSGNNVLSGADGDDVLNGGPGKNVLNGGSGVDTVDYYFSTTGVTINLIQNIGAGYGIDDVLISIENLKGSDSNDVLIGNTVDNLLNGGNGDDTLNGGEGNDTLSGGIGFDTADYSTVSVSINVNLTTGKASGDGNDILIAIENVVGGSSVDVLVGDGGNNMLSGGAGNDTLTGGAGDDTLNGGFGIDTADFSTTTVSIIANLTSGNSVGYGMDTFFSIENLTGGSSNDILIGDVGVNILVGGDGNDSLNGGDGNDTLNGGIGIDTASYLTSSSALIINLNKGTSNGNGTDALISIENVTGGSGNDTIIGDGFNNYLDGFDGNDILIGGYGDDTLNGNSGNDTADYSTVLATVNVNLTTGKATGDGNDTLISIENVIGSNFADILVGDSGNNILSGGSGNDSLNGSIGDDTLNGGTGNDTADFSATTSGIVVNLTTGRGTYTGDDKVILLSIENLLGGLGADTLMGDSGDNILNGGDGNDILAGASGNDIINGGNGIDCADYSLAPISVFVNLQSGVAKGDGSDSILFIENITGGRSSDLLIGDSGDNFLNGGDGDDTLSGGAGNDSLFGGNGVDTADYSSVSASLRINLGSGTSLGDGSDIFYSIENLIGGISDDSLIGSAENNSITGGSGNDTLCGGAGNDLLNGGIGIDTVDYTSSATRVTVNLQAGTSTGEGIDILKSIENIIGGNGADSLIGSLANNVIKGGAGIDILTGRGGSDIFIFDDKSFGFSSCDHITDFSSNDTMVVAASRFGISTSIVTLKTINSSSGLTGALASNSLFVYDSSNGYLYLNHNGSLPGVGAGGVFAVLDNKFAIVAANISIVS